MSRSQPTLSPSILALLDRERNPSPLPATVRAHALVRARAAVVAGVDRRPVLVPAGRPRWAAAAAAVCIVSVGVGAAAYEVRARLALWSGNRGAAVAAAVPASATAPIGKLAAAPIAPAPTAELPATIARAGVTATPSRTSAARTELRLLQQARAAVAREDYTDALPPILQHGRRFPGGRLTEEREALRIKALAELGRTAEARRAAAAFCVRFPRSALLQAVSQLSPTEP